MITFVEGMLVGMALAVIIQIVVSQLSGKSLKPKRGMKIINEMVKEYIEEPERKLTAEEKFDKFCESIKEDEDMAYIDSIVEICKESEFYGEV